MRVTGGHPDYPRIEMALALLGVAINASNPAHPDPLHREAAVMDDATRYELVAGLLAETWAIINDALPGTEPKPVDYVTATGVYPMEDALE